LRELIVTTMRGVLDMESTLYGFTAFCQVVNPYIP